MSPRHANHPRRRLLLGSHKPGAYARSQAEEARQRWYESLFSTDESWEERSNELWEEFKRVEAGALAEETVGRFLDLLPKLDSRIEVYHCVEFRGPGLPYGDLDHIVVVRELSFAIAIETKYRLDHDKMSRHAKNVINRAKAVEQLTEWWTYPALCEAVQAIRDDEGLMGRSLYDGNVLVADVRHIGIAIDLIVKEFDDFSKEGWNFPEHRVPHPPARRSLLARLLGFGSD